MTKARARAAEAASILWLRNDLRLSDHAALRAACAGGSSILCVYILEENQALRPMGRASRWWLHHSLAAFGESLAARGGRLDLLRGDAGDLLPRLAATSGARRLFYTRRYGAAEMAIDQGTEAALSKAGARVENFGGFLLHESSEPKTKSGGAFRTFGTYWRAASALLDSCDPLTAPERIEAAAYPADGPSRASLAELDLLPAGSDWASGLRAIWTPGESGAQARLRAFLQLGLATYAEARDELWRDATSRLSPHLRFGEISPRQIVSALCGAAENTPGVQKGAGKFLAELGWREFNYHVFFHRPDIAEANLQKSFDAMAWRSLSEAELAAWREGRTGYPVVDAGMRELSSTGFMHNRARMIAASFLVKHLLGDWRIGESWFWDALCDADPANNPMNWQWVAGTGADAAPFFRVFNPILQGEKFDPKGEYVRRYAPELRAMPDKWIHQPWRAPATVLREARIELGKTYPWPMVDHIEARKRALAAFAHLRQ